MQTVHDVYDLFTFIFAVNMLPCAARFTIGFPTSNLLPVTPSICTVRHSYLMRDLSCITEYNTRLVNRIMDKYMSVNTNYRNLEPPFMKLASSHPITYAPKVDPTRASLGFGRWALPKLKKELHHDDILVVMSALNSIHDLVHNQEKAFEALQIGLVDRLTDMMLHERDFVRERICMIFHTLACIEPGRAAIIRRYKILHNLAILVEDEVDAVRHKAQITLERISLSPLGAGGLNCADYMVLLLRLVGGLPKTEDATIIALHLATLKMLLNEDVKELALKHSALDILIKLLEHPKEEIKCNALDCIAMLCQDPKGREEAVEKNLGFILCKKLFEPSMEVRVKVAGALAFATIQSETRRKLCKACTVEKLTEILEYFHISEGQLMALKVLNNLVEHPAGKSLVRRMKGRIQKAFLSNMDVERHRRILMNSLKKKESKSLVDEKALFYQNDKKAVL